MLKILNSQKYWLTMPAQKRDCFIFLSYENLLLHVYRVDQSDLVLQLEK